MARSAARVREQVHSVAEVTSCVAEEVCSVDRSDIRCISDLRRLRTGVGRSRLDCGERASSFSCISDLQKSIVLQKSPPVCSLEQGHSVCRRDVSCISVPLVLEQVSAEVAYSVLEIASSFSCISDLLCLLDVSDGTFPSQNSPHFVLPQVHSVTEVTSCVRDSVSFLQNSLPCRNRILVVEQLYTLADVTSCATQLKFAELNSCVVASCLVSDQGHV